MCRTGRAFIYETGVVVEPQIATTICQADNNGASLAGKNSPRNSAGRKRAARPSRERSRADLALVISDLSVHGRAAS